ncbi:hypothetical protein CSC82_13945 [Rhodobacteraceae bacterium 4F10]|nr:hypothetical protein CSC82_13945 [Rhodobacteraceae bacterium 4F10]
MRSFDIRRWAREGLLAPGHTFGWQWSRDGEKVASINVDVKAGAVQLRYRSRQAGEDWQDMNYTVRLLSQPCHLGGVRKWFECPARGCGKRVAILYGGQLFACRNCHQLVYPSQRQQSWQRMFSRAQRIKAKLGWHDEHSALFRKKPKGMHQRIFDNQIAELDRLEMEAAHSFDLAFKGLKT